MCMTKDSNWGPDAYHPECYTTLPPWWILQWYQWIVHCIKTLGKIFITHCTLWLVLDVLCCSSTAPALAMMSLVQTSTWISWKPILAAQHCLEAAMWSPTAALMRNRSLGLTGIPAGQRLVHWPWVTQSQASVSQARLWQGPASSPLPWPVIFELTVEPPANTGSLQVWAVSGCHLKRPGKLGQSKTKETPVWNYLTF